MKKPSRNHAIRGRNERRFLNGRIHPWRKIHPETNALWRCRAGWIAHREYCRPPQLDWNEAEI